MLDFNKTYDVVIGGGGRAHTEAACDPEGTEPEAADDGALPGLGLRRRDPCRPYRAEGLWHRRHDLLPHTALGPSLRLAPARSRAPLLQHTANERLPQYQTEAVLRARAAEVPGIDIGLGWAAEGLEQGADSATVTLRGQDGETRLLTGRYVVGADGSNSTIRELAGIRQTKSEHDKLMVLLVFRSTQLHELLIRYPDKQFYCVLDREIEGYWMFFGRVDLGSTWFFHAPVPLGTTRENFDFKAYLERAVGAEIEVDFEHIGFWELRIALADRYGVGRVSIAGDACHSHPPYGGYGINTGLEDVRNLGWKLAAMLEGWGGARLLDTYTEERQPVFKGTADHFIERFIHEDRDFLNAHSPEQGGEAAFREIWDYRNQAAEEVMRFEPDYQGSSIVTGEPGKPDALGTHEFRARGGHHLAPASLDDGQGVFEALGPGFTLLALGVDADVAPRFKKTAADLGVPLKVVSSGAGCKARTRYEAPLVLVRPDQYIAWAGAEGDPGEILAGAVGRV